MPSDDDEEKQLRSVALQNAQSILLARQRADRELLESKEALERKTAELSEANRRLLENEARYRTALAVPFSCGSSAAQAWGRASRAASRLASAWRMTGSLRTASSNTPTRSLAGAAPENASNTSARVEARFIAFPSGNCQMRPVVKK